MACTQPKPCTTAVAHAIEAAGTAYCERYLCDHCKKVAIVRLRAVAELYGFDLVPQTPETSVAAEVDGLLARAQEFINDAQDLTGSPCKVDPNKLAVGLEHVLDAVRTMNRAQGLAAMAAVGAR